MFAVLCGFGWVVWLVMDLVSCLVSGWMFVFLNLLVVCLRVWWILCFRVCGVGLVCACADFLGFDFRLCFNGCG